MSDDEPELMAYLKTNVSADLPFLIREAATSHGFANSSDWVRDRIIAALVRDKVVDKDEASELASRQPRWGNGKGATSPEYIAKRYGRPWPPESAQSASKPGEKVSQGG